MKDYSGFYSQSELTVLIVVDTTASIYIYLIFTGEFV